MNNTQQEILCIGSVLWDIIGRSTRQMRQGSDVPGRIRRLPGGVAMNIAMTLARHGLKPSLLSALGRDAEGDELAVFCEGRGIGFEHIYRSDSLPTDSYMAVEGSNGLIAAIADAHSLEAAGEAILAPLFDGTLGSDDAPYIGPIALDGNLTAGLLAKICESAAFSKADLRIAPASPGKAERLKAVMQHPNATLYVNCEEAGYLCDAEFTEARNAALALVATGAHRAIVTNGSEAACDCSPEGTFEAQPPSVKALQITGAGDTFMAAHIAAELAGDAPAAALQAAQNKAAAYVAGDETNV
ncbi:kinase [Lentibacter algarum]|uniref:PfkB family carbohydrate kinase n=1 Tax=Lentibacter algarum TaxID=576131 RepID=UPI001C0793E7|nr:PfkB family carbohydrate kinase [Lentibacter algarum]MBU2982365.1 kinase [Lentibacter algarum]